MTTCRCIEKIRSKNKIVKYVLEDQRGNKREIAPDELKKAMFGMLINVTNLKLTSDNRLIDKEEHPKTENTKRNKAKIIQGTLRSWSYSVLYKLQGDTLYINIPDNIKHFSEGTNPEDSVGLFNMGYDRDISIMGYDGIANLIFSKNWINPETGEEQSIVNNVKNLVISGGAGLESTNCLFGFSADRYNGNSRKFNIDLSNLKAKPTAYKRNTLYNCTIGTLKLNKLAIEASELSLSYVGYTGKGIINRCKIDRLECIGTNFENLNENIPLITNAHIGTLDLTNAKYNVNLTKHISQKCDIDDILWCKGNRLAIIKTEDIDLQSYFNDKNKVIKDIYKYKDGITLVTEKLPPNKDTYTYKFESIGKFTTRTMKIISIYVLIPNDMTECEANIANRISQIKELKEPKTYCEDDRNLNIRLEIHLVGGKNLVKAPKLLAFKNLFDFELSEILMSDIHNRIMLDLTEFQSPLKDNINIAIETGLIKNPSSEYERIAYVKYRNYCIKL